MAHQSVEWEDVKAIMFLSSALGSLDLLKKAETATHTRRYREIVKSEKALCKLLDCYDHYKLNQSYDVIKIGTEFFDSMQNKLDEMLQDYVKENK